MSEPDPLSEVLRNVQLSGAIFLDAELSAPWGFASPPASSGARLLAPSAEHLILFHLLVEGTATVRIAGQASVRLEAGDIAVLPRGDAHELWNGRVTELIDSSALLPKICYPPLHVLHGRPAKSRPRRLGGARFQGPGHAR